MHTHMTMCTHTYAYYVYTYTMCTCTTCIHIIQVAGAAEGVEFAGAAEGVEAADVVLVASSVRLGSRLDQRRSWSSAKSAPLLIESERTTMLICKSHSNGPTTRVQRPTATHTATRRWHEPKRYIKNLVPPAM